MRKLRFDENVKYSYTQRIAAGTLKDRTVPSAQVCRMTVPGAWASEVGGGLGSLNIESWHFSIKSFAKKVVFFVSRRKNEFSPLLAPT